MKLARSLTTCNPNKRPSVSRIKYSCQPIRGLIAGFNPSVNFGKLPAQASTDTKRASIKHSLTHRIERSRGATGPPRQAGACGVDSLACKR